MNKFICLLFSSLIFLFTVTPFNIVLSSEITASPSSEIEEEIKYELPYPGLLPDNPLYFLRIIRDRIVSFLISDPLKKSEFNLLQADKRLNAGIYLLNSSQGDEKKISLAISTISKAENYFGEALHKAKEAQGQGMEIKEIVSRLIDSSRKHQQELSNLEKKSPQKFKDDFANQEKRAAEFQKEAESLI